MSSEGRHARDRGDSGTRAKSRSPRVATDQFAVPGRYDFNEADHVGGRLRLRREQQLRVIWDARDEAADLPASEATTAAAIRAETAAASFYPVMTNDDGGCSAAVTPSSRGGGATLAASPRRCWPALRQRFTNRARSSHGRPLLGGYWPDTR